MFDEKYATQKVKKRVETQSPDQAQVDKLRISAGTAPKLANSDRDRYIEQPSEDNSMLVGTLNKTKTTN